ncbi:septal ring lytic transglycosylase RlpA family protein [Almyronema epifaneia]|uniref:Probable endolytic peptidoglycan transglycosylase RlpA n=1 Tax=Almyronema epifaneia S1 TaxID=2991925 RepID=A0ABW6IL54_9CYAN
MSFLGFVWLASLLGSFFTPQQLTQPPNKEAPQRPFIPTSIGHILTLVGQHLSPSDSALRPAAAYSSYTPHGSLLGSSKAFSQKSSAASSYVVQADSPSSGNFSTFLSRGEDYSPPVQAWFQGVEQLVVRAKLLHGGELGLEPELSALVENRNALFATDSDLPLNPDPAAEGDILLADMLSQISSVKASSFQRWSSVADIQVIQAAAKSAAETSQPQAKVQQLALLKQCSDWQPVSDSGTEPQASQQVWVKGRLIGTLRDKAFAHQLANKLRRLLQEQVLRAELLKLTQVQGVPAAQVGNEILFVASNLTSSQSERQQQWVTIKWIDQLRLALGGEPLDLGSIQALFYGLTESQERFYGTASWYGPYFHGRQTATGEIFNQEALTAAHKTLPFGTRLKITNRLNDRSVVVRINDRGPYIGQRSIDLSRAAARCLGSEGTGVIPYEAVILQPIPETVGTDDTLDASKRRRDLQAHR